MYFIGSTVSKRKVWREQFESNMQAEKSNVELRALISGQQMKRAFIITAISELCALLKLERPREQFRRNVCSPKLFALMAYRAVA